jgi:MFS family permease
MADMLGLLDDMCHAGRWVEMDDALRRVDVDPWDPSLTIGLLTSVGAAAGSFAILIGGIARYLPENRRAFAAGFINAGASFGPFVFAPVLQWGITHLGWVTTLLLLAASALLVIPLAFRLTAHLDAAPPATAGTDESLADQLRHAARDRSYLLLHLAFFTCGFHVAFLVTHMPGQVAVCGLAPAVSAAMPWHSPNISAPRSMQRLAPTTTITSNPWAPTW